MNNAAAQTENLNRVATRIDDHILAFCRARVGHAFFMHELLDFVLSRAQVAPDSPGRILRDLKARGAIDYVVVSRRHSLYQLTKIREE